MRLLLYMNKEYLFPTDYTHYLENFQKMSGNVGNKVFYNAAYNFLNTEYNDLSLCEIDNEYKITNFTLDEINDGFDALIIVGFLIDFNPNMGGLGSYIDALEGVKIPIHILSASVNIDSEDKLDKLCKFTKSQFSKMKRLVLSNGGSVATRGEFTQFYFETMGMPEAVMTGCPSLFQNGHDFSIKKKDVTKSEFNFVVCGNKELLKYNRSIFEDYPESVYIDQDQYAELLYGSTAFCKNGCVGG